MRSWGLVGRLRHLSGGVSSQPADGRSSQHFHAEAFEPSRQGFDLLEVLAGQKRIAELLSKVPPSNA